nr:hypothetical protein [Gemmatimonadales bacterium]
QEIPIIGQTAAQTAARGAARYGDEGLAALVAAAGKKPFWKKAMGWVLGLPLAIVGFTLGGHWLEKLFGLRERSLEEIQKELLQYEEARKGLPEYAARVDKAHVLAPEAQEHIGPRVARMETYLGNLDSVTQQLDNLAELTKSPSLKAKADRARDKAEGATSKSKAVGNQVGADVKTPVALRPDAKEDDKTILYILGGGLAVGLIYHLFLKKK